jgi:MFS family permease
MGCIGAPGPRVKPRARTGKRSLNRPIRNADFRRMPRLSRIALAGALLAFAALRIAAVYRTAFNWDEFALFHDVALTAQTGELHSAGHAGLPQAALLPLVRDCHDEIAVGRIARLAWLALTWSYLGAVFAVLYQLLPADRHRVHDAALGTALLGLFPAFLEWSIQVRTDQVALAGGAWGAALLLASRRRAWLALVAGVGLGVGWLGTQKLAYVAALAGLLAAGDLALRAEWRLRRETLRAAGALAGAAIVVVGWRWFVSSAFAVAPGHAAIAGTSPETVRNYLDVFNFYRETIGYSQYRATLPSLGPHLALLAAMTAATLAMEQAHTSRLALAWAVVALGTAVGAFHDAAFAYFLMTLGLFAVVALALALPAIRSAFGSRWPSSTRLATPVIWAALLLGAGMQTSLAFDDSQAVQRESLRFVHRNFSPDRAGFQPETALFCGVRQPIGLWFSQRIFRAFEGPQREREVETLIRRFRSEPVHYLVQSFRLNQFPEPVRVFWDENYQPYRGSVFVAGRRLRGEAGERSEFELLIAAPYRWLPLGNANTIRVDGERLAPAETRMLGVGRHTVAFDSDQTRGLLVLAVDDPPRDAPISFYKAY